MTRRLLPVLAAGLVLAACGSGTDDAGGPAPSTTSGAVEPSATTSSDAAPADSTPSDAASTAPADSSTDSTTTGSTAPAAATPATSEPNDAGSAVVPAEVPEALKLSAPLIGGGDIELATLAGRPVLLWFWAPW